MSSSARSSRTRPPFGSLERRDSLAEHGDPRCRNRNRGRNLHRYSNPPPDVCCDRSLTLCEIDCDADSDSDAGTDGLAPNRPVGGWNGSAGGINPHRHTQALTDRVKCRSITLLLSEIGARGVPVGTIEVGSTPQSSPRDSSMRRRMVHGTEVPCYFRCVPPGRRAPLLQAEGRAHGAEPVASCV